MGPEEEGNGRMDAATGRMRGSRFRCHIRRTIAFTRVVWGGLGVCTMMFGCAAQPDRRQSDSSSAGAGAELMGPRASTLDCADSTSAPRLIGGRIRRLTRLEIGNTLSDLLSEDLTSLARSLEPDTFGIGYSTGDERGVSSNYLDALKDVAEQAAAKLERAIAREYSSVRLGRAPCVARSRRTSSMTCS